MSSYIAFLDREHLENSIFLTAFAQSLAKQGNRKGIIIHSDSEYTERLIQTGMMREDAANRAIRDLNRRLIGLFADQGVAAMGLHGFQKSLVQKIDGQLRLDKSQLNSLHAQPCLLLSALVDENGTSVVADLQELARLFTNKLEDSKVVLFSKSEKDDILVSPEKKHLKWDELEEEFIENTLPDEFRNFGEPVTITTATDFANWPNLEKKTKIS